MRVPILEVHSSALKYNLELIRSLVDQNKCQPKVKVLIPVKANAYGCGLNTILSFARTAEIDMLGVANLWEAKEIRKFGFKKEIILLGSFYKENIHLIFKEKVIPIITDIWQIQLLEAESKKRKCQLKIHIKWDTGMGRLGILPHQKSLLLQSFLKTSFLQIKGMMTHFSSGDKKYSQKQCKQFLDLSNSFIREMSLKREDLLLHSANSYAILNYPKSSLDMIRPGLIFYGYFQTWKDYKRLRQKFPIKPCLRLASKPFSQRYLPKGSAISYSSMYKVKKNNYSTGVFPLGYADGIPVGLSNKISFSGFPLLGRVTMDQIILGGIKNLDQIIEILGENSPPLEYWAHLSRTITYEVMTGFSQRLQRKLI